MIMMSNFISIKKTNQMNFKTSIFLSAISLLCINCKQHEKSKAIIDDNEQIHGRLEAAQNDSTQSELYFILKEKDSIMFERSYNQLDTSVLEDMATEDVEFYHDQGGATYTRQAFINGMKGLGNLSYKARREVKQGSIEVYPMYKNGELYAGILKGEHSFYAKEPNEKPEYLTSTAKYTTLWVLENNSWKMSRIYSYDHQSPERD